AARPAQSPVGPPPVPPRPVMRAVPTDAPPAAPAPPVMPSVTPVPRVVPPASVTPAGPAAPPFSAPPFPAPPFPAPPSSAPPSSAPPSSAPPPPPLPGAPATPYPSVPVPGVRRSLPLPPIPGRDLPAVGSDGAPDPAPVRAPVSPAGRRLTRAAVALVALLTVVAAYYVGLYFYVDRSIDRVDALVTDGPEVLAPQLQESAQTYLVVGTALPGRTGQSAVSALIAHVSAGGDQAVLVSVPPTALNDTPTCRDSHGDVRPAVTETFASALQAGGPSCLVRSVQQLTGLRVDHYLAVDLGRLPGMVDALGDVSVCLSEPSTATGAQLSLPAGDNRLSGDDVRGYLRPGGTGSDVTGAAAAQREQLVLTSTLRTALGAGTVADPLTLTRFLSRASDAFTVDADTTLGDVRALGATLGDLPGDAVERTQMPVAQVGYVPAGTDQAVLVVDATATRELFDAVIDEGRLPAAAVAAAPGAQASGGGTSTAQGAADSLPDPALTDPVPEGTTVTVAPAGVTLDVLDATGGALTAQVADGLAAVGFRIGARGVEPAAVGRTVVRYGPAALEPARTVAAAVPGALLLETDEVGGAVQLVIGPDYTGLNPVDIGTPVPTTAAPAPVETGAGAAAQPCS
ncbi:MAG: Cell envelope-related transcriptional attenuator, partial [Modestobacter sp.]|nr:Cell envelope-related transcriptional attenuator [Modestobacter sp.]